MVLAEINNHFSLHRLYDIILTCMYTTAQYESIVRQYSAPLYWHIRRMVVCHEDAEDILQDTLSSIFLHLRQVRDPSKLQAWLYTVATNKAKRFLSRKARELHCEDISSHLCEILSGTPYVNYEKAAAIDLHKAILKLPVKQQLAFNLRFFDELEYEQISRITGMSVETLRVNYHIARNKVTKYIDEEQL